PVGHGGDDDVVGHGVEPGPGVVQQGDVGPVVAVDLDHLPDQLRCGLPPGRGQHLVEDRAPHAGLERRPGPLAQAVEAELVAGPGAHRREAAADVVAFEVERVVDVDDDEAAGPAHDGASASSTNTAAS